MEMQDELTKALINCTLSKVILSLPSDLFSVFFKAPKVEGEMTKSDGYTGALPINPDLLKALETSCESSMANWCFT